MDPSENPPRNPAIERALDELGLLLDEAAPAEDVRRQIEAIADLFLDEDADPVGGTPRAG